MRRQRRWQQRHHGGSSSDRAANQRRDAGDAHRRHKRFRQEGLIVGGQLNFELELQLELELGRQHRRQLQYGRQQQQWNWSRHIECRHRYDVDHRRIVPEQRCVDEHDERHQHRQHDSGVDVDHRGRQPLIGSERRGGVRVTLALRG